MSVRDQIRAIGDPLIEQGANNMEVRAAVLDQLGIGIGGGGGGSMLNGGKRCPYCDASGNGGHGGFCPNGTW